MVPTLYDFVKNNSYNDTKTSSYFNITPIFGPECPPGEPHPLKPQAFQFP